MNQISTSSLNKMKNVEVKSMESFFGFIHLGSF